MPEEKIRTWVSYYRLHGIEGLRPKRSACSAQFKLLVLAHQDREQLSSRQVAAVYGIRNPNQVGVWRRNLDEGGVEALGTGSNVSCYAGRLKIGATRPLHAHCTSSAYLTVIAKGPLMPRKLKGEVGPHSEYR